MCDTLVVTDPDGHPMLFGKNSDREPNEAQSIVRFPANSPSEAKVRVTYIDLPQVPNTHEVILSKPFHMWGAEMGANEYGVCIGNEALFTKVRLNRTNTGLTGMDLLRLALEREKTARGALELITFLIETHGQDACGGYTDKSFYYSNGFLIADSREAWVLESAGLHWAARRVQGVYAISNGISIETEFDYASPNLIDYARKQGWVKRGETFNFRKAYSDRIFTHFSFCHSRRQLSMQCGGPLATTSNLTGVMQLLRCHGSGPANDFTPARANMTALCMHAGGLTTPSQTTGSMMVEIHSEKSPTVWLTGTSAPCLSIYHPFFFPGTSLLETRHIQPGALPDQSLWWKHEQFHRRALFDYPRVIAAIVNDQQTLEDQFIQQARHAKLFSTEATLNACTEACIEQANAARLRWYEQNNSPVRFFRHPFYHRYWRKLNARVGLDAS